MPPQKTKKNRASGASATQMETSRSVAIQSPATPERGSTRQGPTISAAQKQALIDNLQLEITERARKLRAQYALHAQGLRSRLEMRTNRIPQSLRPTSIEQLVNQYSEQLEPPKSSRPLPLPPATIASSKAAATSRIHILQTSSPERPRGTKRQSSEMNVSSDKENAQTELDMPKKRAKTTAASSSQAGPVRGTRTTSRKVDPSKVLSPKSHNSRQLPQSPFKSSSPGKSYLARPISPIKQGTVAAATASLASLIAPPEKPRPLGRPATKAGTTGSIRGRKATATTTMAPPPVPPKTGRGRAASSSSDTSTGTTVVTKKASAKRGVVSKMASGIATATAARKGAGTKKEVPAPSATGIGGRVLRARR